MGGMTRRLSKIQNLRGFNGIRKMLSRALVFQDCRNSLCYTSQVNSQSRTKVKLRSCFHRLYSYRKSKSSKFREQWDFKITEAPTYSTPPKSIHKVGLESNSTGSPRWFLRPKRSIGHAFTACIRTGNQNQGSFNGIGTMTSRAVVFQDRWSPTYPVPICGPQHRWRNHRTLQQRSPKLLTPWN